MRDSGGDRQRVAVIGGGVAGLATALALRDRARAAGAAVAVTVFEKDTQSGGNLRTINQGGWQFEWGPNGFLDNEPATLRLVDRLGLRPRLLRSNDAARHRFLLVNGRLEEIPLSPKAFLSSRLLSAGGKLRMAGELLVPRRKDLGRAAADPATDETIDQFGERRLGREFADVMLDPMVKGVFGGESKQLSLAAAFPRMVELERDHGGLFRAMIALGREKRRKGRRTDAGPTGVLHSFDGGMAVLVDALAAALESDTEAEVVRGADVQALSRDTDGWTVRWPGGERGGFAAVVDAAPAHAAAVHVRGLDAALADDLARIPYAPMAVIALGYARGDVGHDLNGFGMLVPGRERKNILGALWSSSIFPGLAPEGRVMLRCMAGGAGNPGVMDLGDEALVELVLADLRGLFGLRGKPELVNIIRHQRAIAQYVPGHLARLQAIDAAAARHGRLWFSGSAYRGIAVNACVKETESLADRIMGALTGARAEGAEVAR
ncbi:MAG: protoporphyrinogen oxidase [bacterium]|nr:protoporphyrinogen oxidase [bacterium]